MKKILVIEDDITTAFLVEQVLLKHGFNVDIIGDGDKALDSFKQNSYDVVITDVYLPNKDGLSLLKEIKSYMPNTKVIVMSGGSFKGYDVLKMALNQGADRTARKPDDMRLIGEIVDSCFEDQKAS